MHRFLVCSDIHGNLENLRYALKEATLDPIEGVIIAGDTEVSVDEIRSIVKEFVDCKLYMVRGNCDYTAPGITDMITFELPGNITCMLTHGHRYHVKEDLFTLGTVAQNLKANLVVYGHTHEFEDTNMGRIRIVNPGALNGGRYSYPSYVLMTIDNGKIEILHRVMS